MAGIYKRDTLEMYRKGLDAGGAALYESVRKPQVQGLGSFKGRISKRVVSDLGDIPTKMFKAFEDINNIASERKAKLASTKIDEEGYIDMSPSAEAGDQEHVNKSTSIPKYPENLGKDKIEDIIRREARLRNIKPSIAIKLFRHEGAGAYQSNITTGNQKKEDGREASFGPFQLYIGGGLGNQYEEQTGRLLRSDNTLEGITTQIQFALDMAVDKGWSPWYGSKAAGIGPREGLEDAVAVYNWRSEE